jgi:hypothetical protein
MTKTYTLNEIIEQLDFCNYECEGGSLKTNEYYCYLKEMVNRMKINANAMNYDRLHSITNYDRTKVIEWVLGGCAGDI